MVENMGTFDRVLRASVIAPAALALGFVLGVTGAVGIVLLVVGVGMLATAATGFCPTYALLGIATGPDGIHRVGRGLHAGHA